jgi:hypothetical protein
MIGCYDFCGHYEWTFAWVEKNFGRDALLAYWKEAIADDSQLHAARLIKAKGFAGMEEYWGHTLAEEGAGYSSTRGETSFRIDMHECPSKGFLIANGLAQHPDYCDHCIGWIGPMMKDAGFVVDHEHNHLGKCWWVFRHPDAPRPPSDAGSTAPRVENMPGWATPTTNIDRFDGATGADQKQTGGEDLPPEPPKEN